MVSSGTRIPQVCFKYVKLQCTVGDFLQSAQMAVTALNVANVGTSGVGIANSTYEVLQQWMVNEQPPSMLTIVQLSSSLLFFGHAVYNFRTTATIIEETQANVISDYQKSLRSNRHR